MSLNHNSLIDTYKFIIKFQFALTGIAALTLIFPGISLDRIGIRRPSTFMPLIFYVTGLIVITGILLFLLRSVRGRSFVERQLYLVREVRPASSRDTVWFIALCITVGICEEILFRGYGMLFVSNFGLTGLSAAAIVAVPFGIGHFYQGVGRAVWTAFIGFALGWVYVASGSLLPAIVAHILSDLQLLVFSNVKTTTPHPN
jgi:membrane protease YdiL (CAAX protease family)